MTNPQNLNINANLNTSNFDSSIDGMKKELRELQKIDITILSEEDARGVLNRMGQLKDSIQTIDRQIRQADPGAFFQSFTTLASPAISAMSTMSLGMRAFGVESERVNEIQQRMMVVISALSTLQAISDANKLKALVQQLPLQAKELSNRIRNTLLIKAETAAVVEGNVARTTTGTIITRLTTLQRIWNAVVASNPILAVVAAVAALAVGIVALTRHFRQNTEQIKENEKSLNGVYIENEKLRSVYDRTLTNLRELQLEYRFLSGEINEVQRDVEKLTQSLEEQRRELRNEYIESLEEVAKKTGGFWNTTKNFFLALGNTQRIVMRNNEDFLKRTAGISKDFLQTDELLQQEHNQRMVNMVQQHNNRIQSMVENLNEGLLESDRERLRVIRDRRLREVEESLADETEKQKGVIAIWNDYNTRLERIESQRLERQEELRKRSIQNIENFMSDSFQTELEPMEKEMSELTKRAAELRVELMSVFEGDIRSEKLREQLNLINEAVEHQTEMIKQKYNELFEKELFDFRVEQNLVSLREMEEDEIKSITLRAQQLKMSEEETQQVIQGIREKYRNQEIDEYRSYLREQQNLGRDMNSEILQFELKQLKNLHNQKILTEEEYLKRVKELRLQYDKEYADEQLQFQEFQNMKRQELEMMFNEVIFGLSQTLHHNKMVQIQDEMKMIEERYNLERKSLQDQLRFGLISQTEYNQRLEEMEKKKQEEEKKIRQKQARVEKQQALYQIGIQTAVAIVKALADLGPILGSVMAGIILTTGAIQAAIVNQQQIPQFRTGSKDPFEVDKTGLAHLHQGEMVVRPEAVDIGINKDIIRGLNEGKYRDLRDIGGLNWKQMIEYVDLTLQKYHEKDVVLRVVELEERMNEMKSVKIRAEQ